ncbi:MULTISPECIES: hypothetical protein [unclassified Agarivorans]|uniref:hypothetical protein n=1 Tax=unclassified Agarivorans TaxID=2636026 RepID=UPI0026E15847|nr:MULTISPECIES: hypothetical protein [unclassified Agarivorans]MDO6687548.1 hypothetical protein [Agarivorans sp. 3_MG-2023]MDO6717119.1 hypothetical protein [Agarivorans sp. 2_MG-2023]
MKTKFLTAALLLLFVGFVQKLSAEPLLGFKVSKTGEDWIGTANATFQVNDKVNVNAELDSTGYLELGAGYGQMLGRVYAEAFTSYGRAENVDIYDLGIFAGTALSAKVLVFASSSHQWRETKGFPVMELELFDQREWKNSIGASYDPIGWLKLSYTFKHDRLLEGGGWLLVENDNISSHEFMITAKPKWVEPYLKYVYGEHRVRPGEPVTNESTVELGVNFKF